MDVGAQYADLEEMMNMRHTKHQRGQKHDGAERRAGAKEDGDSCRPEHDFFGDRSL